MAGKDGPHNPLVSDKAPETSLSVQLHPLVLLTISDYITRHTLRRQAGPMVGAVIGQQTGRSYTLEHAFECIVNTPAENPDAIAVDPDWFAARLEQYRDVHKAPQQLDLVALFMLGPADGPRPVHLTVLKSVQALVGSDAVMLLLFHPDAVERMEGGKLPISLYESFEEQTADGGRARVWEREFEVETGEAEMIGVDFVAKGGGNAAAVAGQQGAAAEGGSAKERKGKGKSKAKEKDGDDEANGVDGGSLSAEDEELIASLTAKANAIKMLDQRLGLISAYLSTLPKSRLTDSRLPDPPPQDTNHALLRNTNAMLSRLPLLAPPSSSASADPSSQQQQQSLQTPPQHNAQSSHAASREREDVHLTSLLAALTRSVAEAQTLGSRFMAVQRERGNKERAPFGGGGGGGPRVGPQIALGEGGGSLMDTGGAP